MTGAASLTRSDPVTDAVPLTCNSGISALIVTVTAADAEFRACQVPLQRPSPSRANANGGSPLENVATTEPLLIGAPQLSIMRASTDEGQRAGARKSAARLVKTGTSSLGAHPSAARAADLPPEPGTVSSTTLTLRIFPSANRSVSASRRTPAGSPLVSP